MKYLHLSARHAADIEPVSGARLRKTGIFLQRPENSDRFRNEHEIGFSSVLEGSFPNCNTGWLGDSVLFARVCSNSLQAGNFTGKSGDLGRLN